MSFLKISLEGNVLVARLPDGRTLCSSDAIQLAAQLAEAGFNNEEVTMLDWHEDVDHAPTAGQKIAIRQFLQSWRKN